MKNDDSRNTIIRSAMDDEQFEIESNQEDEFLINMLTPSGHIPTLEGDPINIPGIE